MTALAVHGNEEYYVLPTTLRFHAIIITIISIAIIMTPPLNP